MPNWTANLPPVKSGNPEPKFNHAVRMDDETHRLLGIVKKRTNHSMMALIRALVRQAEIDTRGPERGGT